MKYLRSFNESKDEGTYSLVPMNLLYYSPTYNSGIGYKKISHSTISRILSEFPVLSVGKKNPAYIHKMVATTFYDRSDSNRCKFDIDVYEIEDEWFYLEVHVNGSHYAWKCDQLDGLFDCIRGLYILPYRIC